jgi:hypothetical protein
MNSQAPVLQAQTSQAAIETPAPSGEIFHSNH